MPSLDKHVFCFLLLMPIFSEQDDIMKVMKMMVGLRTVMMRLKSRSRIDRYVGMSVDLGYTAVGLPSRPCCEPLSVSHVLLSIAVGVVLFVSSVHAELATLTRRVSYSHTPR
jgi:hypothetical protein